MVQLNYRVELKSASVVTLGLAQYVMITGMSWMLEWLADSWGMGMMLKVGILFNKPVYVRI